jgi:predicted dehydrogenase
VTLRRGESAEVVEVESGDSYTLELENLADAIDGRAPALLGRDDAVGQARTIDALYRSAESGTRIAV